jgi:hypothetical protein
VELVVTYTIEKNDRPDDEVLANRTHVELFDVPVTNELTGYMDCGISYGSVFESDPAGGGEESATRGELEPEEPSARGTRRIEDRSRARTENTESTTTTQRRSKTPHLKEGRRQFGR